MKSASFVACLAIVAGCNVVENPSPAEDCARSPEHASRVETFLVVGHRGAAAKEVENTIPSMERALADGANAVEIDLSLTKDGVVILWHDWDPDDAIALGRQSGSEANQHARPRVPPEGDPFRRPIDELTLEEVRQHFGYTVDDRPAPVEIPTLDTFLEWASTKSELAYVLFDIKIPGGRADRADVMIPKVREAVAAKAPALRYVLLVAHGSVYDRASPLVPDDAISYDVDPGVIAVDDAECSDSSSERAVDRGRGYASTVAPMGVGPEAWSTLQTLVTCDLDARDRTDPPVAPKKVFVATIDDREQAECLIDMGVDGILSDDPGSLRRIADDKRGFSR